MKNPPLFGSTSCPLKDLCRLTGSTCNSFVRCILVIVMFCCSAMAVMGELNALPGTDVSDSSFSANWELADGAITHRLDVAIDEGFNTFVSGYEDLNVGNATTWLVDGLASGVTYFYRIRALFADGDPTISNTIIVETPLVPGEQKWKFVTEPTRLGPLALTDDGAIIFAGENGLLFSVDSESGTQNWMKSLGLTSKVRPSISPEGIIYVSGYAINAETGDVMWNNGLTGNEISIGPGNLIILNTADSMVAVDKESGNPLWAFDQAFELAGPVISEQQIVYFAGRYTNSDNVTTNNIYAVDYLTGVKLWEYDLGARFYSAPIIGQNGDIYCAIDGKLVVLNASGVFSWEINGYYSYPIITAAGDLVGGSLSSANIETRTENWARISGGDLPETVFEPVIGDDGTIYVPMLAGGLWAFDSTNGSTLWSFSQSTNDWPIYGALIGHDGTVFFGTSKGELYAVNSASTGLQDSQWPKQARNNSNTSYGPNDFFFYSPNSITVDSAFQWIELEIGSNTDWELEESIPWVFLSETSGEGEGNLSIIIERNESGSDRSDVIAIGDFEIPIFQSGLAAPVAEPASNVGENSFLANWGALEGATKYFLDVSVDPEFNDFLDGYENRDLSNSNNWFVEGLDRSTRYYYRFRAQVDSEISLSSNVIAVHTLPMVWELGLSVQGNIGGSVVGDGSFEDQSEVTIQALASDGYKFVEWLEDDATFSYQQEESFILSSDKQLVAQFKPAWDLNLIVEPVEGGSVAGGGSHVVNERATITAVADPRYRFVKWKLGDEDYSISSVDTIVSDVDLTLVACFEKIEWELNTTADFGRIDRSPDLAVYDNQTVVELTAVPDPGFRFDSWSGDVTGAVSLKDIIMNSDKNISAHFILDYSEGYHQWLDRFAPGNTDIRAINSNGELDFDGLPNYLEFVLGTSFREGDRSENPELQFREDGQAVYTFYSKGPLQDGRLFIGMSADLSDWGWVELFYGSGIWVSSDPEVVSILDTQLVGSLWRIEVELVDKNFFEDNFFLQLMTSDSAP